MPMPPLLPLESLPEPLRPAVDQRWRQFLEAAEKAEITLPEDPEAWRQAARVWATSDFVALACGREPALFPGLWESGDLGRAYTAEEYPQRLAQRLEGCEDETQLGVRLRRFRRREMVRIAWRELAGSAALEETLEETSRLAEACIEGALGFLYRGHCERFGTPRDTHGTAQPLVVLGMGKLGARELNFSSDIDLIYAYPAKGETDHERRPLANEEFFTRLGRALAGSLNEPTYEGFVFRVDLRLRPFGDSGPLAMNFDAMELYYQSQGRGWERYAMIKARVVAGDRTAGAELEALLRPFVYRRYLDFGAFENLREMKALIEHEVVRKGMAENVKLGPGGIREVEFIGQAFQLVHGGRNPALQVRPILTVLARLVEADLLPAFAARRLADAYRFLRRVENRLQEWRDEQTQKLPEEDAGRLRLAFAMGFDGWAPFKAELDRHRRAVQGQFEQTFAAPQAEEAGEKGEAEALYRLWQGELAEGPALALLEDAGFEEPAELLRRLTQFREGRALRSAGEQGRRWLNRLMPLLLGAVQRSERPAAVFIRLLDLLEQIARRTAYLALLVENPMALSQVVRLYAASPWIAGYLDRHPALMDELLDPRSLYAPLRREELEAELGAALAHLDSDDQEGQMDGLRHFKNTNLLRVAAADISGGLKLMRVSDYLTEIAELCLEQATALSFAHLAGRYGAPRCIEEGAERHPGFAVIGYGKLGGVELGYGSDLDIVFLHDSAGERQQTDGERSIDNATFFGRLGQRVIHMLETLTAAGVLYEVDPRLRPHGASGPLVSSLAAFTEYQRSEAWTWEHQALVRARVVVGDGGLRERFEALRLEILTRERERERLAAEVREMRARMRENLDKSDERLFDLKQGSGGIIDIEFLTQYLVLALAHDYPRLARWTDDIRILATAESEGIVSSETAQILRDAYRGYRAAIHRCKLQEQPALLPAAEFADWRREVGRIWEELLGQDSESATGQWQ